MFKPVVTNYTFQYASDIPDTSLFGCEKRVIELLGGIVNPQVKSIRFDKKYTTVTWNDNTTTRVGCMLEDEYNKYEAFCAALAKRVYGSTSSVKHIVDTKDEQIEIDKQRKEREAQEKAAQIRKARKDRIWIKKRAKKIALENAAQELAKKLLSKQ